MDGLAGTSGDGWRLTSVACPDCPGVLEARYASERFVLFRCRVGHSYSLEELAGAKEEALEAAMWGVVVAAEELSGVVRLARERGRADGGGEARHAEERLRELAGVGAALRELLERQRPIDLAGRGGA